MASFPVSLCCVIDSRICHTSTVDHCVLCRGSLSDGRPTVTIHQKGSTGINQASEQRGDDIKTSAGHTVHSECRMQYCNPHLISKHLKENADAATSTPSRTLRSQSTAFNFEEHCLFCSKPVTCLGKKRSQDDAAVFPVRTEDFQATLETLCKERGDECAHEVLSRIEFSQDLHASDAIYHQVCSSNFITGK